MALVGALLYGGLVACYAAVLGRVVGRYVEAGSHESADRAQVTGALWIALPHALMTALDAIAIQFTRTHWEWASVLLSAGLTVLAPLLLGVAARRRLRARRAWLEQVGAGNLPNWRLIDASHTENLPHLVRVDAGEPRTLVRVHDAEEPFREGERHEPIAFVASPRGLYTVVQH
jgi:hypothetical protein